MDKYILSIYTDSNFFYRIQQFIKRIKKHFLGDIVIRDNNINIYNSQNDNYQKNGIKYVTHNKLDSRYSAFRTLTRSQKVYWLLILFIIVFSFALYPYKTMLSVIGFLTFVYFLDFIFTIFIVVRSFGKKSEIKFNNEELVQIDDKSLPVYTILCPLYKEWEVVEQFAKAIEIIDWPKDKLEVILLLESDDTKTINKVYDLKLPSYFKIEIVPDSQPKTKPKACNYGLLKATGKYTVIYDAEDKPDPLQLKKAYLAFNYLPDNVVCLQSKLNYYNQDQNILTRLFTAEYSYWFDVALPGLQTLNTIIPLGGTSNHFKTAVLKELQGWDPFNVTEDCDLGTRLFKKGFKTSVIDSETLEEANSNLKGWLKQRSRWIKGYMQTYLVHMRNPLEFLRKYKHHAILFQLIIGMRMVFMLLNPVMWIMTIAYFTLYPVFGPFIDSLYPWYIFYPAVFCLVFANFTYFYSYMIASAKKDKWELILYVFFIPFYWIMTSISASIAFYQLLTKPYYWEKTTHGLHLGLKKEEEEEKEFAIPTISIQPTFEFPKFSYFRSAYKKVAELLNSPRKISGSLSLSDFNKIGTSINKDSFSPIFLANSSETDENSIRNNSYSEILNTLKLKIFSFQNKHNISLKKTFSLPKSIYKKVINIKSQDFQKVGVGGGILIMANMFANFSNYLFNAVLGRNLSFENFGSASFIANLHLLLQILTGALFATVSYKTATLFGRRGGIKKDFWIKTRKHAFYIFLPITILMFAITDFMNVGRENSFMVAAVSLTLLFSAVTSVDGGFLSGNLKFIPLACLVVLAPVVKFIVGYTGMVNDNMNIIYFAQTASVVVYMFVAWLFVHQTKETKSTPGVKENIKFPKKFYLTSAMNRFSVAFFLSADVVMAKMFLAPEDAGKYAILSLIGKIIYFLGSLVPQLITPIIGKEIGEGKDGFKTFYKILPITAAVTFSVFVLLGIYPQYTAVRLFGDKVVQILPYVFEYSLAVSAFTIASTIALFHQTKKQYIFSYLGFTLSIFEIAYIVIFHNNIGEIVESMYKISMSYLASTIFLHLAVTKKTAFTVNLHSLLKFFKRSKHSISEAGRLNILIFNWRDTKHKWQGGAEVYVQELAARWVKKGYGVTIFCGNDGENKYDENIKGVHIIRRGGFFTLYFWAGLYYIFKLKKHFDFIIDCENGIPFFTPLFSSKPKILLIHHVHQQVFRENLPLPLAWFAMFLESKVMKFLYKNVKIVTVSESSKKDIVNLGISDYEDINIVNPGINLRSFSKLNKYHNPTFSYLGRLMPYKNVDVLIKAFNEVVKSVANAKLIIAGKGPASDDLHDISQRLKIKDSIEFKGYVTEDERREILGRSWVMIQPSSFEGWGITVTEANASGTPVIASNTSGLRDSVLDGQTGLLVKTGSIKELAQSMSALVEMEGFRKRISKNAYDYSRNFSWNDSAEKFLIIMNNESDKYHKLTSTQVVYAQE